MVRCESGVVRGGQISRVAGAGSWRRGFQRHTPPPTNTCADRETAPNSILRPQLERLLLAGEHGVP